MLIIDIIFEIIGDNTSRLLLPVISFGKWHVQSIFPREDRAKLPKIDRFNWAGMRSTNNGKIEIQATMAGWIGTIIWLFVLIIFIYMIR